MNDEDSLNPLNGDCGDDFQADEAFGECWLAQHDDDPNPYAGTYSEE